MCCAEVWLYGRKFAFSLGSVWGSI